MKLSEMTTEQSFQVITDILPYVMDIVGDEKLVREIKAKADIPENATADEVRAIVSSMTKTKVLVIVPMLLKDHRENIFYILARISGKTAEECKKQSILTTVKQILDICQDRELMAFFSQLEI